MERSILDRQQALRTRVSDALAADPQTGDAAIEVSTHNGVITLLGEVNDQATVQAAGAIAASQPGTISVINSLKVTH